MWHCRFFPGPDGGAGNIHPFTRGFFLTSHPVVVVVVMKLVIVVMMVVVVVVIKVVVAVVVTHIREMLSLSLSHSL